MQAHLCTNPSTNMKAQVLDEEPAVANDPSNDFSSLLTDLHTPQLFRMSQTFGQTLNSEFGCQPW
jgi:hypothetical protein